MSRLISLLVVALAAATFAAAPASAATQTFRNQQPILIPGPGSQNSASPYPSSITVGGMAGPITDVKVVLHRFGHTFPSDVDILLVSPAGHGVLVMSDACSDTVIEDFTWVFSQDAPNQMVPPCDLSVYRPTNLPGGGDFFPFAPPGPYGESLATFNNQNANGEWRLYVFDDAPNDSGDIELGWSLTVTTGSAEATVPGTGTSGTANPYPLSRTVSGEGEVITDLDVQLEGVWHQRPDDLDLLLVGPRGQSVVLMSDACDSFAANAFGFVWNDLAPGPMPDTQACSLRDYRPADYEPGDVWPAPAPPGPHAGALSAFNFTDPNGEWRLFVVDDSIDAQGFFTNPFHLLMSTRPKAKVAFAGNALLLPEGTTRALTLKRSAPGPVGPAAVTVRTLPASATSGSDFRPVSKVVDFAAGEREKTVEVESLADAEQEPDESFVVAVTSPTGDAATAAPSSVAVTIPAPTSSGPGGDGAGGDRTAPVLRSLTASPPRFRVGRRPTSPHSGPRTGTRLTIRLSEPASVRFDTRAIGIGRRDGGACRKVTRTNRDQPRCRRLMPKGGFTRSIAAGRTTVAFSGRVRGRALKPGRYALKATPTDAAGNAGAPRSIDIRIVR
jgi:subtilisin-like proprotein convertase family protein